MSLYSLKKNYYKNIFTGWYFHKTILSIIKIGKLNRTKKNILDFGCGYGILKKSLPKSKIFNYDIDKRFSDYSKWQSLKFDIFVSNQVFYLFSKNQLIKLLDKLKKKNPKMILIIGISYQNILSKLIIKIFNLNGAHNFTKLSYNEQISVLKKKCLLIDSKNNFCANRILKLKFKI